MAKGQLRTGVDHLRRITAPKLLTGITDGELLQQFIAKHDESAFESLVKRHGPYVRGVCLRILGDPHEADDAFQATFLVLMTKANSINQRDSIGGWLYRVACRTAWRAKSDRRRRRSLEGQVHEMTVSDPTPDLIWRDIKPVLDEELNRLPAKYQTPFVLCCLQGKTKEEAARELGLSEGTLSSRLARARERLQQRLTRRGLAYSTAAIGAVLVPSNVTASLTPSLMTSTINAASAFALAMPTAGVASTKITMLAEGVVRSMLVTKLKITAAIVGSVILVSGAGGVGYHLSAKSPAGQQAADTELTAKNRKPSGAKPAPGQTLTGRVVDETGKPVKGATVHAHLFRWHPSMSEANESIQEWHIKADQNGSYTLAGVKDGGWWLELDAIAKGLVDTGSFFSGGARPQRIVQPLEEHFKSGKLNDIRMKPGRVLSGRCVGVDDKPVGDARIDICSSDKTPGGSFSTVVFGYAEKTSADGRFEITVPKDLTTELIFYTTRWAPQHLIVQNDQAELGDIHLSDGTRVKGRLIGQDGKPLTGCLVTMEDAGFEKYFYGHPIQLTRKTDRDGRFDFPPLKGRFKLFLSRFSGRNPTVVSAHPDILLLPRFVEFDGTGETNLSLEVGPTFGIRGKILCADGRPPKRCRITVYTSLGEKANGSINILLMQATPDMNGEYVLKGIPKGLPDCMLGITASGPEGILFPHPLPGAKAKSEVEGGVSQFVILEELDKDLDNVNFEVRPMER